MVIPWLEINNSHGLFCNVRIQVIPFEFWGQTKFEICRYDELGQTIWILIKNKTCKIMIGTIYGPQENMTTKNELKLLYKTITEQIEIAKEKYQQVFIIYIGDFNVKIENHILATKKQCQKGGNISKE